MIDSSVISKVLQQTSKLTLPNFGTFIKKPDGGDIIFSQFYSEDDNVFTSVVMNAFSVDADEAKRMVGELILDITTKITVNGEYIIPEVGKLVQEQGGAVKLRKMVIPVQPQQPVLEPEVSPQPQPVPQPQPQPQPRQQVIPQPIVGFKQPTPAGAPQQVPYGPRQQVVMPQRNQQRPPQPSGIRPPQNRMQQPPRPMTQPQNRGPRPGRARKGKKKTDWLLIIAIVVALLALGLILYGLLFTETIGEYM